jgi:hypothetical protein
MKINFLFPLLLIGIANARPQEGAVNEDFETLTDGVEQLGKKFCKVRKITFAKKLIFAGKDISNVVNSKTEALVFIGGNAFNYTMNAAGTVSSGLGQAGNNVLNR